MDTLHLIEMWLLVSLPFLVILSDPNVPVYLTLKAQQLSVSTERAWAGLWLLASLRITRRSFRNDWIGRGLRAWELRAIRRNPTYAEFFPNDRPDK
jgi:hypothetical protein